MKREFSENRNYYETRHYATADPASPDRAAFDTGVALGTCQAPASLVSALVTRTRDLVAEAVETDGGARIIVTTVYDGERATVHAVLTGCIRDDHFADFLDPSTAAVLGEVEARWGSSEPRGSCPCLALTLLPEDWKTLRAFLTPP